MSRPDAARKLLALGPLGLHDFREITGWGHDADSVLSELIAAGDVVRRQWVRTYVYALAGDEQ